jgi:UPF0716 protein FxsA
MFFKILLLFIFVPIAELYLFLTLGARIGLPATLAIILLTAVLGASLTKTQGAKALANFRKATAEGRLPHQEALDGLLILLAGAVLLTPGFLTDTVGFLLLLPPSRAVIRGWLAHYLKGRIRFVSPSVPPQAQAQDRELEPERRDNGDFIDV